MGQLERAKIYVLPDDGKTNEPTQAVSAIEVCFNPKEYSLEKSVDWDSEKAWSDAPQPEFKAPKPMTLSVTLQFDTYEERISVRDKWVRQIERLTMMKKEYTGSAPPKTAQEKQKYRPAVILFVWGRFTFKGVIESLSQKYTMFLSDGTPVRAECALKIRNVIEREIDKGKDTQFSKTKQGTKQIPVHDNDRLDQLAHDHMGDASLWPELAAFNGIVDPGNIADGDGKRLTTLQIPQD